jgi:hypothetical protein
MLNCKDIWDDVNKTKPKYDKEKNENEYWINIKPCGGIIDSILKENHQIHAYLIISLKISFVIKLFIYNKTINSNKLGYDFFNNKRNCVVRSDTGTGKTTSFKHYAKNNDIKFISLVSRISLGQEQYSTFNKYGVNCKFYQ